MAKPNNKEIAAKVIAKAWKDPAFKKKLLSNPKEALKEMGYSFDTNMNIRCIEDTKHSITLVLPLSPADASRLSEKELSSIAAAGTQTIITVVNK